MASRRGLSLIAPLAHGSARPRNLSTLSRPLRTKLLSPHGSSPAPIANYLIPSATCTCTIALQQPSVRYVSDVAHDFQLAQTPLYDLHLSYGAKIVPFGGYAMPVLYKDLSLVDSHNWTREKASLFDVSHMVQHYFSGPRAGLFLERITPSSATTLAPHTSTLSALLHPQSGGIVDDTIITALPGNRFYVVTNAACRDKDALYLGRELADFREQTHSTEEDVKWERLDGRGLIALQGPLSSEILNNALPKGVAHNLQTLLFGQSRYFSFELPSGQFVHDILVSRGGYTGEDGFEISIPAEHTAAVAEWLLESAGPDKLRLAGLGARDSLRLEAGMCLYGHDLDDTTTPVEAALGWIVAKERREKGGFHGDDVILAQLKTKKNGGTGVSRRRVGLIVEGPPAREGAEIVEPKGPKGVTIGKVTSGCPSPTLKKNIAMGYIKDGFHKSGTEVEVVIRGKARKAQVTKMPFVPSKYWKGGLSPA
ncbi:hypothetical protein IWX46DRAFT_621351 [Phyllosticta citricarpa]|uniref:Aminomethyltransferase n=1 Tax=Phyllosticta citricarpa TaxID=55181 RepID=A0ABR1M1W5_9PEZI